ncbi:MAG: FAD binding domain-containing protein [Acidimicrobiales bacterium]
MKPPPFTYHRPATVVEAARLLAELGEDAKVLAGGQSLIPLLNFRLAAPDHLVDVNHIAELDAVEVTAEAVVVGATVRHARLLAHTDVVAAHPLLVEATGWIAHGVIRNRGTVCGSLAHGDPAAELPAVLALLGGHVTAARWDGFALAHRTVAAADLFIGPLMTSLAADELVVAATFPRLAPRTGGAVGELARRHGDYAVAGVALTVTVDAGGSPVDGRAAYLSCAPTPVVVELGPAAADPVALGEVVAAALDPTADIHASAEYRRHLAVTLTRRAVVTATARARASHASAEVPT